MPDADMKRVILHWTAGSNRVSDIDLNHYHFVIDGKGTIHKGVHSIADNENTRDGNYAAHTLHANTGSIGVALAGMFGAVEYPFDAGEYPINAKQWKVAQQVVADLCERYNIPVKSTTVLSHAEVEPTLGIKQRGKWDIARLPWKPELKGPLSVGVNFRWGVQEYISKASADALAKKAPVAYNKPSLWSRFVAWLQAAWKALTQE